MAKKKNEIIQEIVTPGKIFTTRELVMQCIHRKIKLNLNDTRADIERKLGLK